MSANFRNFWPLPPYHRHSSRMLMKGIFDPYVLWPIDHQHMGTPLPLRHADVLNNGWSHNAPFLRNMVHVMNSRTRYVYSKANNLAFFDCKLHNHIRISPKYLVIQIGWVTKLLLLTNFFRKKVWIDKIFPLWYVYIESRGRPPGTNG